MNIAAAAVTAVLTFSSGKNMLQTVSLSRQNSNNVSNNNQQLLFTGIAGALQPDDSTKTVISKVQCMNRKELLELYFRSRGPADLSEIEGAWDGCLLDNNSRVMTFVTAFITDRLFGMGRKWNGKEFGVNSESDDDKQPPTPQGINRFHPRSGNDNSQSSIAESEHLFDMRLQTSKLDRSKNDNTQKSPDSLVLEYTAHQSPLSLWRTMMDEVRIVPLDGDTRVLIGLGYMAWSGGRLNASPFLLFRDENKE